MNKITDQEFLEKVKDSQNLVLRSLAKTISGSPGCMNIYESEDGRFLVSWDILFRERFIKSLPL